MDQYTHHAPTRVVGGVDSLERLSDEVSKFPRNCLVVSGRRSARLSGLLGSIVDLLQAAKIETTLFDQIEPNPTVDTIKDGAEMARSNRARWILGVGGGSAIDAAKAIALMTVNQGDTRQFFNQLRPENTPLPVVAIPTTSGTGSEVTQYAVLTDVSEGDKFGIAMPELFPQIAILDPKQTVSMPENVTVDTGLDALCHAVEACFSKVRSPYTDVILGDAIRRVHTHLPVVRSQPDNLVSRAEMQVAACSAGFAIANTGTLVPHALGYPITVRYELAHGRATILLLPAFLEALLETDPDRVSFIGDLLGNRDDAPKALRSFIESLGVAPRLRAYGVHEEDFDTFAELAKGKKHLEKSPGEWTTDKIKELYKRSF
ncbi:MAG: iron-containing alcohol dehydrogenase [Deltaproteobacteria bacterium]|nr:iron-containing alcohol dehydrogenase [Deltaproteobacteria bacterium]